MTQSTANTKAYAFFEFHYLVCVISLLRFLSIYARVAKENEAKYIKPEDILRYSVTFMLLADTLYATHIFRLWKFSAEQTHAYKFEPFWFLLSLNNVAAARDAVMVRIDVANFF